eukprot:CAMPEP_0173398320 /NCGR_PEP_ID=MMETSP1356-20130122/41179_1 /TAXON_ID=77927 ORGANISM="Hemiselmis virescens, Strain PCC157" /NCGR_SAMPLE_ID=MMETSP1356 /ASSEMBLY_ACC=CAM_ASM_000847 /LENGTH=44 /DNA_ID= /DNA_START= /DNA_END= /DNA_ORIENTATION=
MWFQSPPSLHADPLHAADPSLTSTLGLHVPSAHASPVPPPAAMR